MARAVTVLLLLSLSLSADENRRATYAPLLGVNEVTSEMAAMIDASTRLQKGSEVAAFLLIDASGRYELQRWQNSEMNRRHSFTGLLPARAIAILHTHPNEWARPSAGDRREAKRIGLPIFVITRWNIWVAEPDGALVHLVDNVDWREGLD